MDERSIKRLAIMVATAIVIILVLKHVGLRMAASAKLAHQQQAAAHQVQAPASTPAQDAQAQAGNETDALIAPGDGATAAASAPVAAAMPDAAPLTPEAASAPATAEAPPTTPAPPATDPTVSTPPASLDAN